MKKIEILIEFICSAKTGKTGKTKQGFITYTPDSIYDLFSNNNSIITNILGKNNFDTDYTNIFSLTSLKELIAENTYDNKPDSDITKFWFIKTKTGKIKLNKTPADIVRVTAAKVVFELGQLDSDNSKKEVKKRLKDEGKLRLADTYRTDTQLKDPIDQTITNGFSSNSTNKIVKTNFNRKLIKGKKDKYIYTLTNQGIEMAREALDILTYTNLTKTDIINQEIQLNDKFQRLIELKAKIEKMIYDDIISVCEIDRSHRTFEKENGDKYFVGHHVIPNSKSSISNNINTEVIGNYISLCPNCHDSIHYGSDEVKMSIIDKILRIQRVANYLEKTLNTTDVDSIKKTILSYV